MTTGSYKNRLGNYEAQPPDGAWEFISRELDGNNEWIKLSKKMFDFEVRPPASSLKHIISSTTNKRTAADSYEIGNIKRNIYKIIAAAIIIGIVAGTLYVNYNSQPKNAISATDKVALKNEDILSERSILQEPRLSKKSSPVAITTLSRNVHSGTLKHSRHISKVLHNTKISNTISAKPDHDIMIAAKPIRNSNGDIIENSGILKISQNHFISITGPNGQQTKISSKFLDMLLFINDDSDIDEVDGYFNKNFLESLTWKTRFHDWRNRIIKTSLVPSSSNFMDILEFKDLITQDK